MHSHRQPVALPQVVHDDLDSVSELAMALELHHGKDLKLPGNTRPDGGCHNNNPVSRPAPSQGSTNNAVQSLHLTLDISIDITHHSEPPTTPTSSPPFTLQTPPLPAPTHSFKPCHNQSSSSSPLATPTRIHSPLPDIPALLTATTGACT